MMLLSSIFICELMARQQENVDFTYADKRSTHPHLSLSESNMSDVSVNNNQ